MRKHGQNRAESVQQTLPEKLKDFRQPRVPRIDTESISAGQMPDLASEHLDFRSIGKCIASHSEWIALEYAVYHLIVSNGSLSMPPINCMQPRPPNALRTLTTASAVSTG